MSVPRSERWLGLELRHLLTLHAVAEEASFSRAAARLGYTQSAVSHQIAALERIVGARLIDRRNGRKTATLTEHGAVLLRHTRQVLGTLSAAEADLQNLDDRVARLRVGTFESISVKAVPTIVREFARAYPRTAIELVEGGCEELHRGVELGHVDLSFVLLPLEETEGLDAAALLTDPFVLLAPAQSELAKRRRKPTLRDLAEMPLISFEGCWRLEQMRRELGLENTAMSHRVDDNSTVQAMVAAGIGSAVVPQLVVEPAYLDACVEIDIPVPPRLIGIAWNRDRKLTSSERHFISVSRRVCASLERGQNAHAVAVAH